MSSVRRPYISDFRNKIVTPQKAAEWVRHWRQQGRVVGFTNGCFDLLHPGHVQSLAEAATRCDELIVGLNSDASVSRLKGVGRPLQTAEARATVLAALTAVDMVVVFEEDTPALLIEDLLPDVLFKGSDYSVDQIAGAQAVIANGGSVELLPLVAGHSTTALVARSSRA